MLAPSNAVIEDTWECLGGGFDGRGQFGFVRVGNQFGNSPFYSGAAWVWFFFFGGCMACPLCLSFSPFCTRRNWNCCLQISVGLIFAVGSFVETDTLLLYIHY